MMLGAQEYPIPTGYIFLPDKEITPAICLIAKNLLVNDFGKGITVYKGSRGYLPGSFDIKTDCDIIVMIVTRLEIKQIQDAVFSIDPKAFVYVQAVKEATGGILKAKAHSH